MTNNTIAQQVGSRNTSTKYENNDHLFSAALRLNAFAKNAVTFLKLNCFTNAVLE